MAPPIAFLKRAWKIVRGLFVQSLRKAVSVNGKETHVEERDKIANDEREKASVGEDVEGHKFASDEREASESGEDEVEGHKWATGDKADPGD
jgi:hypothetical protein